MRRRQEPESSAANATVVAHRSSRRVGIGLMAAGLLVAPAATTASEGGLAVTRVNGQTVVDRRVPEPIQSNSLDVGGVVSFGGLVADAGSSPVIPLGSAVRMSGAVNRGAAPYTVEWSVNGAPVATTSSASVELPAESFVEGINEVRMSVTDANGAGASDTVLLVASPPTELTLVDEEGSVVVGVPDEELGLDGAIDQSGADLPFEVPRGVSELTATLEWPTVVNDLDLYLDDPTDVVDDDVSGATLDNPEVIEVTAPAAGDWIARVAAYLSVPDSYRLRVTGVGPSVDPLPTVDAGGPYEFAADEPQQLAATVTAGEAEVHTVMWDLDGDGAFESPGESPTAALEPGSHRVTVKVTDATGFEVIDGADVTVAGREDEGGDGGDGPEGAGAATTAFYLRRSACGGDAEQGVRLSLDDVGPDANGCTNLTYPAAAAFSAAGIPLGDDYPYEEPAAQLTVAEGRVGGTIYFGAQGASPVTEIEVTLTGVSPGGDPVTIGSQLAGGVVADVVGVMGAWGIDLDFPVEVAGPVTELNLRLDVHNAQGLIWVEMDDPPSHIEIPLAGTTDLADPLAAAESRVEVQVVAPDGAPDPAGWVPAGAGDEAGLDWVASVDISGLAGGEHDLLARLVLGGAQVGLDRVRFSTGSATVSAGETGPGPRDLPAPPSDHRDGGGDLAVTGAGMLGLLGAALLAGGVVLRAVGDQRYRRRAYGLRG